MIKSANVLTTIFNKVGPKLVTLSEKVINPSTAKWVGAAGGAAAGGIAGASVAEDGSKTKGFLIGAATGGLLGRYGGKTYAGFGKGGVDSGRIKAFGEELTRLSANPAQKATETLKDTGRYISKNWSPDDHLRRMTAPTAGTAGAGVVDRPLLGFRKNLPVGTKDMTERGSFLSGIGRMTRNVMSAVDPVTAKELGFKGTNVLSRMGEGAMRDIGETMTYTPKDSMFKYPRSVVGKVLGATMASGAGMGAFEGAMATNPDGSPAPLHKKIIKGTTSAVGWGVAAPLMGAKAFAYDIPKAFINPES